MRYSALSDIGLKRDKNEDNWNIVLDAGGNPVGFIIADGMGGHLAGEEASRIAVEEISSTVLECVSGNASLESVRDLFNQKFNSINAKILDYSAQHLGGLKSGTTLSVGLVLDDHLHIAHIGDSRIYRVRDGKIVLLTQDHSYVAELVKGGLISSEEANHHPDRNRITKALGFEDNFSPDFYLETIKTDDIYVYCTDGLYEEIGEQDILKMVLDEPRETMAERLIEKAKAHGGSDNITVIVAWM